jgi:hypothetical protein
MLSLQAHCHHSLGTLYAKTGRREQARTELSAAIDRYRAMGMTFWLPQAEMRWRRRNKSLQVGQSVTWPFPCDLRGEDTRAAGSVPPYQWCCLTGISVRPLSPTDGAPCRAFAITGFSCCAHLASGSGRSWNLTTFGRFSLPPSRWNTVLVE